MKTNTVMRTAAVALLLVIGLTGCGKEATTGLNTNPGDTSEFVDEAVVTATTGFGAPLNLGTDAVVTFAENTAFTPGAYASNYQKGMVANKFDVTIENKGTSDLDLSSIVITPASGANNCTDILDGDNNINGAPTEPIAVGSSTTFTYGLGCLAKVGDPLDLSVAIGDQVVSVTGKLK
jgi:hypothetical protein